MNGLAQGVKEGVGERIQPPGGSLAIRTAFKVVRDQTRNLLRQFPDYQCT